MLNRNNRLNWRVVIDIGNRETLPGESLLCVHVFIGWWWVNARKVPLMQNIVLKFTSFWNMFCSDSALFHVFLLLLELILNIFQACKESVEPTIIIIVRLQEYSVKAVKFSANLYRFLWVPFHSRVLFALSNHPYWHSCGLIIDS